MILQEIKKRILIEDYELYSRVHKDTDYLSYIEDRLFTALEKNRQYEELIIKGNA